MTSRIFQFDCYKLALTEELKTRKALGSKDLTITAMADYCGVQRTYLSKMMNRSGNLSEDQIFLASKYLGLTYEESDFLLLLRSIAATGLEDRREHLRGILEATREEHLKRHALTSSQVDSVIIAEGKS